MIEPLVPASVCAEMFSDIPESTMFVVKGAVAGRRRAFGTVRYCARKALQKIGVPAVPILPEVDGTPRWPVGLVGSMTHCAGYRAAVVTRSRDLCGVGIDAESHAALHWDHILFCAKEAVYKAWFPLTRRWLDIADLSVTVHLEGTFRARLCNGAPRVASVGLDGFDGWWVVGRGLVAAAISVSRYQGLRTPTLWGAA